MTNREASLAQSAGIAISFRVSPLLVIFVGSFSGLSVAQVVKITVISSNKKVMFMHWFVCLSVCLLIHCEPQKGGSTFVIITLENRDRFFVIFALL